MKKYIITKEEREEILGYIRQRNYNSARNSLNQLPELEEAEEENPLQEKTKDALGRKEE